MNTVSIQAHFDGKNILLDEPVKLECNARLIVTVLPNHYEEHQSWTQISFHTLARAYDETEEEYSCDLMKEVNSEYERK